MAAGRVDCIGDPLRVTAQLPVPVRTADSGSPDANTGWTDFSALGTNLDVMLSGQTGRLVSFSMWLPLPAGQRSSMEGTSFLFQQVGDGQEL